EFKTFLRNALQPESLRRTDVHHRYRTAKQGAVQTVQAFVAYLDELEQYMDPYTERQRAFTLLDGLRPDIGRKIRERADMPETRSEMASLAINIEEAQRSESTRSMREPRAGPSQGPRGLP
ncbi:MAG: hypothetical protein M1823_007372, partial [Watsoniomyces obsoletus]